MGVRWIDLRSYELRMVRVGDRVTCTLAVPPEQMQNLNILLSAISRLAFQYSSGFRYAYNAIDWSDLPRIVKSSACGVRIGASKERASLYKGCKKDTEFW